MFGRLFRRDPTRNLQKEYEQKLILARDIQRQGDIVRYSEIMAEADSILQKIDACKAPAETPGD